MTVAEIEPTTVEPLSSDVRWPLLPFALIAATVISLAIDLPVAAVAKAGNHPRWVSELLENAEPFGHGIGATLIVIGIYALDGARRRDFPRLLAGSIGAGLVANVLKLFVVRTRPRDITTLPESIWQTFGGLWSAGQGNGAQSFPSAHTATAVGLAVMLSHRHPQARWYFASMATLVAVQRVQCSAHFPSDVFAGALVGWCTAMACLKLNANDAESSSLLQPE